MKQIIAICWLFLTLCFIESFAFAEIKFPENAEYVCLSELPDGEYCPERFSWSGGSGRIRISCDRVIVENGIAFADIVFSSPNYICVIVNEVRFTGIHTDTASVFRIPVTTEGETVIRGITTAMSKEHEIEYVLNVFIGNDREGLNNKPRNSGNELRKDTLTVLQRNDGTTEIDIFGLRKYLVVPEGVEVLDEAGFTLLKKPFTNVLLGNGKTICNVEKYNSCFAFCLDDDGALVNAGTPDAIDYATLLKNKCKLAFLPYNPGVEQETAVERLQMIGIPVFFDLSGEESSSGELEKWEMVYEVLFG